MKIRISMSLKFHMDHYKFCSHHWILLLLSVTFKSYAEHIIGHTNEVIQLLSFSSLCPVTPPAKTRFFRLPHLSKCHVPKKLRGLA